VLDGLRGFAVLGILLVNIHLMRGPEFWLYLAGTASPATTTADRITAALTGWLASGKFVSSFAIMFGLGAAIIAGRAVAAGRAPRSLLARRYLWLLVLGVAHMLLMFPGDILFVYGLTGLGLLLFLDVQVRTAVRWGLGLVAIPAVVGALLSGVGAVVTGVELDGVGAGGTMMEGFFSTRMDQAVAAFTQGSYLDVIAANAWEALFIQLGQLVTLPWLLGLFLLGFAVGRAGWLADLAAHRAGLRRLALVGILVGLPLNLPLAASGPLGYDGPQAAAALTEPWLVGAVTGAQLIAAPLLAVGYLSALTLVFLRWRAPGPLVATGRMALTAYLSQSVLALIVFAGFGLYGQLSATSSLIVVAGIWLVLLVACPLWLRTMRMGPAEWVWRALTYGRGVPLRRTAAGADVR
jgi:uncharacterized protein